MTNFEKIKSLCENDNVNGVAHVPFQLFGRSLYDQLPDKDKDFLAKGYVNWLMRDADDVVKR
jgi:hypothetical protein